jgi:hypothetical protein
MGRDVQNSEINVYINDTDVMVLCTSYREVRWYSVKMEMKAMNIDTSSIHIGNGDYRVEIDITLPLIILQKNSDNLQNSEVLCDFYKDQRKTYYIQILQDVHAFTYFRKCQPKNQDGTPLPYICSRPLAIIRNFLIPTDDYDCIQTYWEVIHDLSYVDAMGYDNKESVKYKSYISKEIVIDEDDYENYEDDPIYSPFPGGVEDTFYKDNLYPDNIIDDNIMVWISGYVTHD